MDNLSLSSFGSSGEQSLGDLDEFFGGGSEAREARYSEWSVSTQTPVLLMPSSDIGEQQPGPSHLTSYRLSPVPDQPTVLLVGDEPASPLRDLNVPDLLVGDEPPESDWQDGVDMTDPPFTTREKFIDYCKQQLSVERQAEFARLVNGDAKTELNNLTECQQNIKEALFIYALLLLHKNPAMTIGPAMSKASNRVKDKSSPRSKASTFINRFIPANDPKVLYARGSVFGCSRKELKQLASQVTPEGGTTPTGRNATYWLIKLLEHDQVQVNAAVNFLNQKPVVPCPFGNKWDFMNLRKMLREATVDELLQQLAQVHPRNTSPAQQLLILANNGDEKALMGYINHYHKQRHLCNADIAARMRCRVKIPGLGNNNWLAHMVYQYLHGEVITSLPPKNYQEIVPESKRKHRRLGTSLRKKCRVKGTSVKSTKGKGKAKLKYDSCTSDSVFEGTQPHEWLGSPKRLHPTRRTFGAQAEPGSSSESSDEKDVSISYSRKRPSKLSEAFQPIKKIMTLELEKMAVESQPETQAEQELVCPPADLRLLREMAQGKDPRAIAEYIHHLTPFISCDDDIISILNAEHIRPEQGRWNKERLDTYRALRTSN